MSDLEFEAYVSLLTRFLRLGREQREEIRRELQAHLQDALDEACERGESRTEAIRRVLEDFGDAAELAARFSKLNRKRRWIMHGTLTAACLAFAAVSTSFFFSPASSVTASADRPGATQTPAKTSAAGIMVSPRDEASVDDAIYKALAQTVPDAQLQEMPLNDVIEWARQLMNVNVHVQWQALMDTGIDRDKGITISVKGLTVERILRLVLDEAGGSEVKLDFEAQDGILMISTAEALERRMTFEVYDVREILRAAPPSVLSMLKPEKPKVSKEETTPAPDPMPVGPGGEVSELIISSIRPESWDENGGAGSIRWYHGLLVIRSNAAVHRDVRQLLKSLQTALVEPSSDNKPTAAR